MNTAGRTDSAELLSLAVAFYRTPLDFQDFMQGKAALPADTGIILQAANLSDSPVADDPSLPGVTREELRKAAVFFIEQVFLAPGSDYYRILGLPLQTPGTKIKDHYRLLMRLFHPDRRAAQETWHDGYAWRVNEAYNVLRKPESRQAYDVSLKQPDDPFGANQYTRSGPQFPPVFHKAPRTVTRRARGRLTPQYVLTGVTLVAALSVLAVYFSHRPPPPTKATVALTQPAKSPAPTTPVKLAQPAPTPEPAPTTPVKLAQPAPTPEPAPTTPVKLAQPAPAPKPAPTTPVKLAQPAPAPKPAPTTPVKLAQPAPAPKPAPTAPVKIAKPLAPLHDSKTPQSIQIADAQPSVIRYKSTTTNAPPPARTNDAQPKTTITTAKDIPPQSNIRAPEQPPPPPAPARAKAQPMPPQPKAVTQPPAITTTAKAKPKPQQSVTKPPKVTKPTGISHQELNALMSRFKSVYNRGDLAGITKLFGRGSRGQFNNKYQEIFAKTATRSLTLRQLTWRKEGSKASGQASLSLTVRDRKSGSTENFAGKITFKVEKRGTALFITDINHVLWKAPSSGAAQGSNPGR